MTVRDTSTVALSPERSIAHFDAVARDWGLEAERTPTGLLVESQMGTIELTAAGDGTRITLMSGDAAQLQTLRDLMTERFEGTGVAPVWDRAGAGRPANMSLATVTGVERISPSYARIRIEGGDLARFGRGGFHFRLLFGPEGAGWPHLDATGATFWPGGLERWHRPVYTMRAFHHSGGETARIDFDVFLHEGGRTTEWTRRLAPGAEIALTGPGGSGMPPATGWIGMIADETAMPIVSRMLSLCAPETRGEAVIFVPTRADIQTLVHPPGVSVRWQCRDRGGPVPGDALDLLSIPDDDRYVFFAAEREEALAARARLAKAGLTRSEFLAAVYWSRERTA